MKEESTNSNHQERLVRSFGRIKSRKLSDNKVFLLNNLLPKYDLKFPLTNSQDENILEIGFGFGDFLFMNAKNNPKNNFFGFEPHINGVVNLLNYLNKNPLNNIKISTKDVRLALNDFDDEFFDKILILFPDPWPKLKHFKRRLINVEFLDEVLAKKLKKEGEVIIATDHDSYKTWIFSNILESKKFTWIANCKKDWQDFNHVFNGNWTITKYQKKAEKEGRQSIIIKLLKR